jgi:hypothetical protein
VCWHEAEISESDDGLPEQNGADRAALDLAIQRRIPTAAGEDRLYQET